MHGRSLLFSGFPDCLPDEGLTMGIEEQVRGFIIGPFYISLLYRRYGRKMLEVQKDDRLIQNSPVIADQIPSTHRRTGMMSGRAHKQDISLYLFAGQPGKMPGQAQQYREAAGIVHGPLEPRVGMRDNHYILVAILTADQPKGVLRFKVLFDFSPDREPDTRWVIRVGVPYDLL